MKRYTLLSRIASGGMGEVFLARSEGPHGFSKTLVIKRILSHLASDPQFVEMFLDEARLAALLTHPNIVQIYELGEEEGAWYIAMEYIHGRTLRAIRRELLQKRQLLSPIFAARVCAQALQGLHYAHTLTDETGASLNVVHRDVSPDNVLVGFNGQVKLVDFGIAKAATAISTTRSGTVKGKFSYMSPEQLMGQPVDGRTDVYAMGVILFELLTGGRPWSGPTEPALINKILHEAPPIPRERNPALPQAMNDLILRALEKNPADRFASAEEMSLELERFITQNGQQLTTSQVGAFVQELFGPEAAALPSGSTGSNPSLPRATASMGKAGAAAPPEDPTAVLTTPISTGARQRVHALATAMAPEGAPHPSGAHPVPDSETGSREEVATAVAVRSAATPANPGAPAKVEEPSPPGVSKGTSRRRLWVGLAIGAISLLFVGALVGAYTAGRGNPLELPSAETSFSTTSAQPEFAHEASASAAKDGVEEEAPPASAPAMGDTVSASGSIDEGVVAATATGAGTASPESQDAPAAEVVATAAEQTAASAESARASRARPERRRSSARAAAPVRGEGKVALRISPWAEVFHGGKSLGITPMAAVTVPSGRQTFTLRNADLGITRKVTVTVPVNGEVELRADLFDAP